jgi:hypothetical protein
MSTVVPIKPTARRPDSSKHPVPRSSHVSLKEGKRTATARVLNYSVFVGLYEY